MKWTRQILSTVAVALAAGCQSQSEHTSQSAPPPRANTASAAASDSSSLFNGRDLKGWEGNPQLWSVKDGVIHGETTKENPLKGNTFLIWTNGVVDDFELRFSYRIVGGNSGVQYRSKVTDPTNWVVGGYQADFEAGTTYSGILYEERGRGILAQRGQKTVVREVDGKTKVEEVGKTGKTSEELQAAIRKEQWNDYVIIAHGNHLTHSINGNATCDVMDEDEKHRSKSGILALQIHAGPPMVVEFKNISFKRLRNRLRLRSAYETVVVRRAASGR